MVLPVGVLGGRGQRYQHHLELVSDASSQAPPWTCWIRSPGVGPALSVTAPSSGTSGPWKPQQQLRSAAVWALSHLILRGTDSCLSAGPSPAGWSLGMSILGLSIQTHPEPQTLMKATHTQVVRKKTSGNLVWVVCTLGLPFLPLLPFPTTPWLPCSLDFYQTIWVPPLKLDSKAGQWVFTVSTKSVCLHIHIHIHMHIHSPKSQVLGICPPPLASVSKYTHNTLMVHIDVFLILVLVLSSFSPSAPSPLCFLVLHYFMN